MEAFETFQHAGMTCELHYDETPWSPREWDNLGTLVAFPPLAREYDMAERESTGTEDDALDRGGWRLLRRYLRTAHGMIAVPFTFTDYGSGGLRLSAASHDTDRAAGFLATTHERVTELCGDDPEYHSDGWIEDALRGELRTWGDYAEGNVYGFVVRNPEGEAVDSLWGIYPDAGGGGLEYVRHEAREAAEAEAHERAVNEEPDGPEVYLAGVVRP